MIWRRGVGPLGREKAIAKDDVVLVGVITVVVQMPAVSSMKIGPTHENLPRTSMTR